MMIYAVMYVRIAVIFELIISTSLALFLGYSNHQHGPPPLWLWWHRQELIAGLLQFRCNVLISKYIQYMCIQTCTHMYMICIYIYIPIHIDAYVYG